MIFFSRSLLYEHREVFDTHVAVYFNEVKALMIMCFMNEIPSLAYNIDKDISERKLRLPERFYSLLIRFCI